MASIQTIKVWVRPDGTNIRMFFIKRAMLPNETEQDFIDRMVTKTKLKHPEMNGFQEFTFTRQDIKNAIGNQKNAKEKVRINPGGNLFVDNSVQSGKEKGKIKRSAAKADLASAGISADTIKEIFNER